MSTRLNTGIRLPWGIAFIWRDGAWLREFPVKRAEQ
ncbi:hypothetical protein QF043_000674 [Pseudomonas sp. W3I7]|nr:hypothetical protein [Pseudomonas sp. W3I7]